MPGAFCNDAQDYAFTVNGECDFYIEWTWDGVSTPPNCNGTVDAIRWENRSTTTTYYAHIPGTRKGPYTLAIPPGDSGREARRGVLDNLGLQTLSDIQTTGINAIP